MLYQPYDVGGCDIPNQRGEYGATSIRAVRLDCTKQYTSNTTRLHNILANPMPMMGSSDEDKKRASSVDSNTPAEVESGDEMSSVNNSYTRLLPEELLSHIPIVQPDLMMSKESVRRAVEEFITCPTDIIVTTFPKTGTTLVTWICHLLRTNGDLSIIEKINTLYEVVPWPLLSWDIGYNPNTIQGNFDLLPRIFKSHLRMASIYKGCKYIVTIRDPEKTVLSFYNFFIAKKVPLVVDNKDMNVSKFLLEMPFVQGTPGKRASIWEYYAEYHALRMCPTVLILIYEDLISDMSTQIHRIAQFMELDNNASNKELISKVTTMSTKEYMSKHMSKFDEPYERAKRLGRAGDVSQLAPGAKVALQEHTQTLSVEAKQFLQEKWNDTMQPLGYDTYTSFCDKIRYTGKKCIE